MSQTQDKQPKKLWQTKYFWVSITPLLLTLLAFALMNSLPTNEEADMISDSHPTAVSSRTATPPSAVTRTQPPILPATILPTAVPTATPLPELTDTALITLLGPPPKAMMPRNSQVAFYWRFSQPLPLGQQFVLILEQNEITVAATPVNAPNLGDGYQFLLDFADSSFASGPLMWQIQLQWTEDQQPLLSSEKRTLVLLPE